MSNAKHQAAYRTRQAEKAERMRNALREIAEFGRKHPGHGFTCATIALAGLGDEG